MALIRQALDDIQEGQIVPEGEYDLRIVKVQDKESKKGNPITICTIKIEDASTSNVLPVTYVINHVTEGTPEDQVQMRLLETKRFLTLFGVEFSNDGYDTDDLQGQTARCFLAQEEGDDKVMRNKLRLPRLKE